MHGLVQCTCRQTFIYTNIAKSRIECDYWPCYAQAARQLLLCVLLVNDFAAHLESSMSLYQIISVGIDTSISEVTSHVMAIVSELLVKVLPRYPLEGYPDVCSKECPM